MFSAKRKKESKSEIPQWKLDMLAAESGVTETVSEDQAGVCANASAQAAQFCAHFSAAL